MAEIESVVGSSVVVVVGARGKSYGLTSVVG